MSNKSTRLALIVPIVIMALLPLLASWFAYPETHFPPGFGVFPPLFVEQPPGFSLTIFILLAIVEIAFIIFLVFPQWFGFNQLNPQPEPPGKPLPIWFWLGLATTLFFWWLMWTRETVFGNLVYYAFTPLWWGFIFTLDGLNYRFSGGYSLFANRPKTLLISAAVSLGGWFFFEYFDYFALGNWYYPNSTMPELSHSTIVWLYIIAYTTVWPAIFEWYTLFNCCPKLVARYAQGPKLNFPGKPMLYLSFISIAAMVFYPYPLFWVMWVGPLLGFAGLLIALNIWTPFTALANGNWSPMLLMALSTLLNGFFWEIWNYGSAHPATPVTNPNYWLYDIPYVNVIHIFAEMPLLGYFGYLPFGILAWLIFIWTGKVFGFDTSLLANEKSN
ncbi:MAG TPA: mechanosensitive ion channel protein MscS [Methylotenera sp.]|nr:mechanosensitive ion channel protein MscS [Methylotenera sp.]